MGLFDSLFMVALLLKSHVDPRQAFGQAEHTINLVYSQYIFSKKF